MALTAPTDNVTAWVALKASAYPVLPWKNKYLINGRCFD
jgi:hypothetical protein